MSPKLELKRFVDLSLYYLFCFLLGTGLLIHWRLVPGSRGGHGLHLFGFGRHDWGDLHFYASLGFLLMVAAHLWLNRLFIVRVIAEKIRWRTIAIGLPGLIIVAAFLLAPIGREHGRGGGHGDHSMTGSAEANTASATRFEPTKPFQLSPEAGAGVAAAGKM